MEFHHNPKHSPMSEVLMTASYCELSIAFTVTLMSNFNVIFYILYICKIHQWNILQKRSDLENLR